MQLCFGSEKFTDYSSNDHKKSSHKAMAFSNSEESSFDGGNVPTPLLINNATRQIKVFGERNTMNDVKQR